MELKDLGELSGPIVVFGGAYSNFQATQALFAFCDRKGISGHNIIFTGDAVAYCGGPNRTCDAIRMSGVAAIAGNCEKQLAAFAPDCGCGFDEGSACDMLSVGWYGVANRELRDEHRQWMATLPDVLVFHHHGRRFAVIHGGIPNISKFVWSVSPEHEFKREINSLKELVGQIDVVLAGHSGMAFKREIDEVTWINAGVIGMPAHRGVRTTEFLIWDEQGPHVKTLSYDWESAQTEMIQRGLVQGYHNSLETGYWPSEEVLPSELRRVSDKG